MQKHDSLRALAQAKASAQEPNQALARLKARSFGKPTPIVAARATTAVPEPLQGSNPKPLVR